MEIMKEMAKIVDEQNKHDKNYKKMSDNLENSLAFQTACDLIFKGKDQPSGYTEPLLHLNRLKKKSSRN
jgi:malate synthase